MKNLTLTFTILCAFCAFTYAGPEQIPSSGKEIVPPEPIPPSSCFDGWYFGIHGAALLEHFDANSFAEVTIVGPQGGNTFTDSDEVGGGDNDLGYAGGLHVGKNWQRGGWIFGGEVDVSISHFENRSDTAEASVDPSGQSQLTATAQSEANLYWYSTVRPRIGHTVGQKFQVFGTGGLAVGLADVVATTDITVNRGQGTGLVTDSFSSRKNDVEVGWTVGGGIEFCVSEHVILNFTYLYMDLGDSSQTVTYDAESPNGNDTFAATATTHNDLRFHVFQGGISLRY